tara:strand:+ start:134 stop:532 length:399 start_codon:yes stop_codon:yes gene_type:complete
MAHFAKLDENNIVVAVHVVHNDVATDEQAGADFLNKIHKINAVWKQTSYNTRAGVHILGGTPFRKNYAGVDFTYDETLDAFIPPKPYNSWTFNSTTCTWDFPVPLPDDAVVNGGDVFYNWDEENTNWKLVTD